MKNQTNVKRKRAVVSMLLAIAVLFRGPAVSAATSKLVVGYYKSSRFIMKCEFQTSRTVVCGSISTPKKMYLYAYPSGLYKHGTKTLVTWANGGPVSGYGTQASTVAYLSGRAFITARCKYRYGKNKSDYRTNQIEFNY